MATFTVLRWAWDARLPIFAQWQAASQSQGRPTLQPIVHVLIRQAPQGPQQADQEQALFTVDAWSPAWTFRQRGWTPTMSQMNSKMTQGEEMQGFH
ncbi:MAG TPA: hypothetical protein VN207_08955 [Ktedonobacteraceae bacterium]|nr:hypothetical protein [Ktedonobacteraceae bacterium]